MTTIVAEYDTQIRMMYPDSDVHISTREDAYASELSNVWNGKTRALFQFNLSSHAYPTIASATLYLRQNGGSTFMGSGSTYPPTNRNYYIARNLGLITETITFNTRPSVTTINRVSKNDPDITVAKTWSVNVTQLVKDGLIAGQSYVGFTVRDISERLATGLVLFDFASRTNATAEYRPRLVLTFNTEYYVKTDGDDSLDGQSWANALKTIDKIANIVPDGSTVHIGFGEYKWEPAQNKIAPVNLGPLGIKYLPETSGTGGGAGEAKVVATCATSCEPACQTACETICQTKGEPGGCTPTSCQTACQTLCQHYCQTGCEKEYCQTACELSCQDACQICCQVGCEDEVCEAYCETGCEVGCEVPCQSTCELACQATCEASVCQTFCEVIACQTTCELACQTTCELACQNDCEITICETTCETICQSTCELACQSACELACQTTCELACQTTCELACQTTCELACQTACESACQTACELAKQ